MPTICYLESEGRLRRFTCRSTDKYTIESFIYSEMKIASEQFHQDIMGWDYKIKDYGISYGFVEFMLSDDLTLMLILWFNKTFPFEIFLECPSREELEKLGLF